MTKNVLSAIVVALLVAGGASQAQADSCKNVKFQFKNSHKDKRAIQVDKIEFYNSVEKKWRSEDVKAVDCNYNSTCTTKGDDLTDAEGQTISKVKFTYKAKDAAGNWSANITGGEKSTQTPNKCVKDKLYKESTGSAFNITG